MHKITLQQLTEQIQKAEEVACEYEFNSGPSMYEDVLEQQRILRDMLSKLIEEKSYVDDSMEFAGFGAEIVTINN